MFEIARERDRKGIIYQDKYWSYLYPRWSLHESKFVCIRTKAMK